MFWNCLFASAGDVKGSTLLDLLLTNKEMVVSAKADRNFVVTVR